MRPVHSCKSCGFVSTLAGEFTREQGVRVCKDCKEDYGRDAQITEWINQAVKKKVDSEADSDVSDAKG